MHVRTSAEREQVCVGVREGVLHLPRVAYICYVNDLYGVLGLVD